MPELPEVETSRRGIMPHLKAKRVKQVIVRQARLRWPVPAAFARDLPGQSIDQIKRRGKYIILYCSEGAALIHLGMSGALRVVDNRSELRKHDHIDIILSDKKILRYNDPRRFGALLWTTDDPLQHSLLAKLGPEPLSQAFNVDYLFNKAQASRQAIKVLIMNSHVVVGVGNIYASEALFFAGIKPHAVAASISRARLQRLVDAIKQVLQQAIKQGGTTLRDFVNPAGQPGYFKQSLQVYGRADQPCYQCGRELAQMKLAQRSTVYCSRCQR